MTRNLTFLMKRALMIRHAGPWRVRGFTLKIVRGEVTLETLLQIAAKAHCSLTFLTSGAEYESREYISPYEAIVRSIQHAGHDVNDFARSLGFHDFAYMRQMINNNTIKVSMLIKVAKALNFELWQLFCDNDYVRTSDADYSPSDWDRFKELALMGWL